MQPRAPILPFAHSVFPLTLSVCGLRRPPQGWTRLAWAPVQALLARDLPKEEAFAKMVDVEGFPEAWAAASSTTLLDVFRLGNLARLLDERLHLPGDVIECGVAGGGTSLLIALLLKRRRSAKRLWLFDAFQGLPRPDRRFDRYYFEGAGGHSLESVRDLMRHHGVLDQCLFHEGWFRDTFPRLPTKQSFCLAHIDCDLYHPTRECIAALHPRLPATGAMVFDDYYDGSNGVFRAVNEVALERKETVFIGPSCQAFFVKGEEAIDAQCLHNHGVSQRTSLRISFDALRRQPYYASFLRASLAGCRTWRGRLLTLVGRWSIVHNDLFARSIEAFASIASPGDRTHLVEDVEGLSAL